MLKGVVGGAALALVMLVEAASAGVGTMTMGAAAAGPDPQSVLSHAAGTWGACGSWWSDTATEISSGSVCGVDGLVVENGEATRLAEYHGVDAGPQVTVNGAEMLTSDAHWWGGVCGQTVVVNAGAGQASIFRGLAADISNFGGRNCECA